MPSSNRLFITMCVQIIRSFRTSHICIFRLFVHCSISSCTSFFVHQILRFYFFLSRARAFIHFYSNVMHFFSNARKKISKRKMNEIRVNTKLFISSRRFNIPIIISFMVVFFHFVVRVLVLILVLSFNFEKDSYYCLL